MQSVQCQEKEDQQLREYDSQRERKPKWELRTTLLERGYSLIRVDAGCLILLRAKEYTRSQQLEETSRMTESNMNVEIDTRSRCVFGQSPFATTSYPVAASSAVKS